MCLVDRSMVCNCIVHSASLAHYLKPSRQCSRLAVEGGGRREGGREGGGREEGGREEGGREGGGKRERGSHALQPAPPELRGVEVRRRESLGKGRGCGVGWPGPWDEGTAIDSSRAK